MILVIPPYFNVEASVVSVNPENVGDLFDVTVVFSDILVAPTPLKHPFHVDMNVRLDIQAKEHITHAYARHDQHFGRSHRFLQFREPQRIDKLRSVSIKKVV